MHIIIPYIRLKYVISRLLIHVIVLLNTFIEVMQGLLSFQVLSWIINKMVGSIWVIYFSREGGGWFGVYSLLSHLSPNATVISPGIEPVTSGLTKNYDLQATNYHKIEYGQTFKSSNLPLVL